MKGMGGRMCWGRNDGGEMAKILGNNDDNNNSANRTNKMQNKQSYLWIDQLVAEAFV